jgi:hypothetical protein
MTSRGANFRGREGGTEVRARGYGVSECTKDTDGGARWTESRCARTSYMTSACEEFSDHVDVQATGGRWDTRVLL